MYYGQECPHCHTMMPLVEQLEQKLNVEVIKKEAWHNAENAKEEQKHDKNRCGGVPFFYNTESTKWICGEADYKDLERWATGKKE